MQKIFISICDKEMHEKEYILQFLPSLKILGNYETSKDVAEWSVIKERWSKQQWKGWNAIICYSGFKVFPK